MAVTSQFAAYSNELKIENWIWFALSIATILARYAVRLRTVGFKGLQGDDFSAFITMICVCIDAWIVQTALYHGQNLSITEADIPSLTRAEIADLEFGSKVELTAWYSYPTLIWSLKFTMLFFYKRLTFGSLHAKMVKYLMYFCTICYFICLFVVSLGCRPFHLNWQVVPIPPWACTFRPQNTMTVSILNIITDAAILSVPIPMLWKLKIPWTRKLVIGLILSSGLFVIAAAVIRCLLTLTGTPSAIKINLWGIRETMLGVLTVNVPILRPVFNKSFWALGPYDSSLANSTPAYSQSRSRNGWKATRIPEGSTEIVQQDIELGRREEKKNGYQVGILSHSSSQENIIRDSNKDNSVVVVHTTLDIQTSDRDSHTDGWSNLGVPK